MARFDSTDNQHFTRNISYNQVFDFRRDVVVQSNIDKNVLPFMNGEVMIYDGLFKYSSINNQYEYTNTQLNTIEEDVYYGVFYNSNGKFTGTLQNTTGLNIDQLNRRVNLYGSLSYLELNENITNISNMFERNYNLTTVPNFDTSNVTNMYRTFSYCNNLTSIPNFDTSKVINMSSTFEYCSNLTNIPNFNTSNVTNMFGILNQCYNLTSIPNFDTSNVISMGRAFVNCRNLIIVPEFNMFSIRYVYNMFTNCNNLSANSYANIANMMPISSQIQNTYISNIGITNDKFDSVSAEILLHKGYLDCDRNIGDSTQYNIYNGYTWTIYDKGENLDRNSRVLSNILHNNFNTSTYINIKSVGNDDKILLDAYNLFNGLNLVKNITIDLNTCYLSNTSNMFSECYNLINISNFDTSSVINTRYMFLECRRLTSVPNYDTSSVVNMADMFSQCYNLTTVPNFNTHNVIDMAYMFSSCYVLFNIPNFNTSKVTRMPGMFGYCRNLTTVPNFDTSNVTSIGYMFQNCTNLVDVPEFNTSKVTYMDEMFTNCNNLSNAAIQNIINMCLNSSIANSTLMNLNNTNYYSPLYNTKFDNTYYQNRWSELTSAGWTY